MHPEQLPFLVPQKIVSSLVVSSKRIHGPKYSYTEKSAEEKIEEKRAIMGRVFSELPSDEPFFISSLWLWVCAVLVLFAGVRLKNRNCVHKYYNPTVSV